MFEILSCSFVEFCRSIAASIGNVLISAFVIDGHISMYLQICLVGLVISICAYVFNLILKKGKLKRE